MNTAGLSISRRREMDRNDYTDPQCPFCTDQYKDVPPVHPVDVARITDRLDADLAKNDYAAAERHLRYWIAEAENGRDARGLLSLKNELMGLMRKLGREKEALAAADEAMSLIKQIGLEDTVTAGTTYVNTATVYKAFGRAAEAIPIYEKAAAIFERELHDGDMRLGSLYNNMGLALVDMAVAADGPSLAETYYERADKAYAGALRCMSKAEQGAQEMAVTYLNMADELSARYGFENAEDAIYECLEKARELLDDPELVRDGYHAFICEKCAPTFGFYGLGAFEKELAERARSIYEANASER